MLVSYFYITNNKDTMESLTYQWHIIKVTFWTRYALQPYQILNDQTVPFCSKIQFSMQFESIMHPMLPAFESIAILIVILSFFNGNVLHTTRDHLHYLQSTYKYIWFTLFGSLGTASVCPKWIIKFCAIHSYPVIIVGWIIRTDPYSIKCCIATYNTIFKLLLIHCYNDNKTKSYINRIELQYLFKLYW